LPHYPKKSLGQNYLHDDNICRNIVDIFNVQDNDFILEIGPGLGALTKYLLKKTNNLIAVELDQKNVEILKRDYPSLTIVHKDFLKIDFDKFIDEYLVTAKLKVIGNIPYYITSDIIFRIIDNREFISDAQLMMQEEVAQRLGASPNSKAYGILSVMVQTFCSVELLFKVTADCFYPKPKVDSRVVTMSFNNDYLSRIKDLSFFRKFVRGAFSQRRKTLRNSLKSINIDIKGVNGFDFNRRAETLSITEFINLSNEFYSLREKK
jgi:16S rRNA (adenine1518-N6/adenine1519-N6)-dimethyltransferase